MRNLFLLIAASAVFVAALNPSNVFANPACAPPWSADPDASTVNGIAPGGGPESTILNTDATYDVARCASDGSLESAMHGVLFIPVVGIPAYLPTVKATATPDGTEFEFTAYADPLEPDFLVAWLTEEGEQVRQRMLPPTDGAEPDYEAAANLGGITGTAAGALSACSDSHYTLFGFSWPSRGYRYYTRDSSFFNGTTTRSEIIKGHHSWDWTTNDCGYNDLNNFTSDWISATSTGYHTYNDGTSIVDFGDMSNVGKSDSIDLAVTRICCGESPSETDQRYNSAKRWSDAGAADRYDVWNISTHESGHALGIMGDYSVASHANLTMYGSANLAETKKRTLGKGDILGMTAIYP